MERILIVGHGSIGKRHLRIVRECLPDADIHVLRHQHFTDVPEFADGCFRNLVDACAFLPQAAIIANPAPFHLDSAIALAEIGCHLLVEKPIADTSAGVERLLREVSARGVVLQVGYNLRFLPSLEQFRDHVRGGAIGRVLSVRCEIGQFLPSWRPDTDYRQGVSARRELGGGVLLELSHELDYLRWILGDVVWVTAWLGRQSALDVNVEDTAHLILGFLCDASGRSPVAALSLDFIRHDTTRMCTVIGEKGSLRWNGLTNEVEGRGPGSAAWDRVLHYVSQRDDSYRAQLLHFLACVRTGESPKVTGEDGLAVLATIEAARQSAAADGASVAIANFEKSPGI